MGIINQRYTVNSTKSKTKVKMKFIVLAALAVVAVARPQYEAPSYPDVPPQYAHEYAVQDEYAGVDFGANENREGYNTAGSYSCSSLTVGSSASLTRCRGMTGSWPTWPMRVRLSTPPPPPNHTHRTLSILLNYYLFIIVCVSSHRVTQ